MSVISEDELPFDNWDDEEGDLGEDDDEEEGDDFWDPGVEDEEVDEDEAVWDLPEEDLEDYEENPHVYGPDE